MTILIIFYSMYSLSRIDKQNAKHKSLRRLLKSHLGQKNLRSSWHRDGQEHGQEVQQPGDLVIFSPTHCKHQIYIS